MAEWLRNGLQNRVREFNSHSHLQWLSGVAGARAGLKNQRILFDSGGSHQLQGESMLEKLFDWLFNTPRFSQEARKEKMADLRDMWLEEGDPRGEVMAELYEREFGRQKKS